MWPAHCKNRSAETLKDRPDLVNEMNFFRNKLSNVLQVTCKKRTQIDPAYYMNGIRIWFESGEDVYGFLIRQPEFDWQVDQKLSVMNDITHQLQNFTIVYTPNGIVID